MSRGTDTAVLHYQDLDGEMDLGHGCSEEISDISIKLISQHLK